MVQGRAKSVLHGPKAQSLTCSLIEKPHTGWDDYLNMLLSCFRARISVPEEHLDDSAVPLLGRHDDLCEAVPVGLQGGYSVAL